MLLFTRIIRLHHICVWRYVCTAHSWYIYIYIYIRAGRSSGGRALSCKGLEPPASWINPAWQKLLWFWLFSVPTSGLQLVHQRLCYVLSCLWESPYPLVLIGKSGLCGDSGFPLKKYVTMIVCLTSSSQWYENECALEVLLNKTNFLFFVIYAYIYQDCALVIYVYIICYNTTHKHYTLHIPTPIHTTYTTHTHAHHTPTHHTTYTHHHTPLHTPNTPQPRTHTPHTYHNPEHTHTPNTHHTHYTHPRQVSRLCLF